MPTGYSRSPKLLKGALVQFSAPMIVPIPNIIIFQYNPESLSRTLAASTPKPPAGPEGQGAAPVADPRAQPLDPLESFTLSLLLDASNALESPELHPVAMISGVADRLAALELLMYPEEPSELSLSISVDVSLGGGDSGASVASSVGSKSENVPAGKVPPVLFVWGPGRIVPVRVTTFSVEELQNNPLLYPIRAKVSVGLQVLLPGDFGTKPSTVEEVLIGCYKFTRMQKKVLALANLANSVESILGMLPI